SGEFRSLQCRNMRISSFGESGRYSDPDGKVEYGFRQIRETLQHRPSPDEHNTGARLPLVTGAADFIANKMNDLFRSRLQDVTEHGMRYGAWLARTHPHDFENM